jgi:5-methyltetrahydrofolate--homocysteine methyltransferase
MTKGIDSHIEDDVLEAYRLTKSALSVVEGPLMKGMRDVGELFGEGKLFLPQVIRSARVMKKAVAALDTFFEQEKQGAGAAKILLATVKGDVHDIGKNIVGVVLGCNGYTIIDLGVMVAAETIVETALREGVGAVGLSGLITPSLDEMITVAKLMEKAGLSVPLLIGGAAASLAHTALRIAPVYSAPVVYAGDASSAAAAVRSLFSLAERPRFLEALSLSYQQAAARHQAIQEARKLIPLERARQNRFSLPASPAAAPRFNGTLTFRDYPITRVVPFLNWSGFLSAWDARKAGSDQQEQLLSDARLMLERIVSEKLLTLRAVIGFFPASAAGDDVLVSPQETDAAPQAALSPLRFCFLRNQEQKRSGVPNACLADFITPSWLGLFALSAGFGQREAMFVADGDEYGRLLLASLANALAEAFSEELHLRVRREFWAYAPDENLSLAEVRAGTYAGIRPAFGYPSCPDHNDKRLCFDLLHAEERCGLTLTETAMMDPAASVCGMYFSHPAAYHFAIGAIADDQLRDWAARKNITIEEARKRLGGI